jgi:hypothetical protein
MTKAKQTASTFLAAARAEGFFVTVKNPSVVCVHRTFRPGDSDAFVDCDMAAPGLLDKLGARGGSMWGTDGGSVGGAVALRSGRFALNVSGVPKRVTAALAKMP